MAKVVLINVLPLWNKTTRWGKIARPTEELGRAERRACESGVMIKVRNEQGRITWLDSHWFEEYIKDHKNYAGD